MAKILQSKVGLRWKISTRNSYKIVNRFVHNSRERVFMLISNKRYFIIYGWMNSALVQDEWRKFEKKRTGAAVSKTECQFIPESFTQDSVLTIISAFLSHR